MRCTSTGRKCDGYLVSKTKNGMLSPPEEEDHWRDLEKVCDKVIGVGRRMEWEEEGFERGFEFEDEYEREQARRHEYEFRQEREHEHEQNHARQPEHEHEQIGISQSTSILSIDRYHNHPTSTPCSLSELEYHVPLMLQPSINLFATEKEYFCFDFFCRQTNPLFTHYFETTMWTGPMMQACFQPAVQQAMIALGAVHRRFELGITPEAFEYCAFSMKAYSRAMALTRGLLENERPQSAELTIILSWLFGAFEVFQGNDEAACRHLKSGLKAFFAQKFKKQESRTVRRNVSLNEENVRRFFRKLELKSNEIFGEPARLLCKSGDMSELPEVPEHFYSLDHARDVIFTQIQWNFWALSYEARDESNQLANLSERVSRMLQWSVSYAKLCKSLTTKISPCQGSRQAASCLLRISRELSYIILLLQPATTREYEGEKFCSRHIGDEAQRINTMNNHFAKLLIMSDRLLNSDVRIFEQSLKRPSFGVDSGIQPPLYLVATRCRSAKVPEIRVRSTKIRHQAQSLMKDTPREAKMRHALGAYNIAERTSMLEEEAALSCGALPDEISDKARWVDLTCYLEERKVLRSYCIPEEGTGVDGLVWVQEWITF